MTRQAQSQVLFKNVDIYDGKGDTLLEGYDLLVGQRIKEVSDKRISARAARVIDGKGKTLMPGLIDAHFHALAADANLGGLDKLSSYHLAQYARQYLESALQRGFTTIRDAGGADFGLAMASEAGLIRGPRIFYAGRALTQTGGHADFRARSEDHPFFCSCGQGTNTFAVIADGVDEVRRAAREELRKGASQIKIMASGGVASPSDPIWNLQYSEEEIRAIVWEASSWRTYVMAHAYSSEAIARCVEYGVRSIEHGNLIDATTARLVAEKGAFVVPTLITYDALAKEGAGLGLPPVSVAKVNDVREVGLNSLLILKEAGVKTGFGTDLLGDMQRHQSGEFSLRAQVLDNTEILRSATSINAELLQQDGELGTVAPGALADLLLVDGNPLADITLLEGEGEKLKVIMKDGELYKQEL